MMKIIEKETIWREEDFDTNDMINPCSKENVLYLDCMNGNMFIVIQFARFYH